MDTGAPLFLKLLEPSQAEPEVLLNFNSEAINDFASGAGPSDASDSGGGSITVSDGITTVTGVTEIDFTHSGSVTDEGGGVVRVNNTPGGGGSGGGGAGILDLAHGDANVVTPDDSGSTLDIIGSGTLAKSIGGNGELILSGSVSSGGFAAYRKAYSNGNFDIKGYLVNALDAPWGLYVRDSSTGNILTIGATGADNTALGGLQLTSTPGAVVAGLGFNATTGAWVNRTQPPTFSWPDAWFRFTRVVNQYVAYASVDGENWISLGSGASNTWAAAADQIGFAFFTAGGDFKFWSLDGI